VIQALIAPHTCPLLQSVLIDLIQCDVRISQLIAALSKLPALITLELGGKSPLLQDSSDDNGTQQQFVFVFLERLTVKFREQHGLGRMIIAPKLNELDLLSTHADMNHFMRHSPLLGQVSLSGMQLTRISSGILLQLHNQCWSKLEELVSPYVTFPSETLLLLDHTKELKHVTLRLTTPQLEHVRYFMLNHPRLESLCFYTHHPQPAEFEPLPTELVLPDISKQVLTLPLILPCIKRLACSGALDGLAAPNLTSLELHPRSLVEDLGSVLASTPSLTHLSCFSDQVKLTTPLSTSQTTSLVTLTMDTCMLHEAVLPLVKASPRLEQLNLSYVKDARSFFAGLIKTEHPTLCELSIEHFEEPLFDSASLLILFSVSPKLLKLKLPRQFLTEEVRAYVKEQTCKTTKRRVTIEAHYERQHCFLGDSNGAFESEDAS